MAKSRCAVAVGGLDPGGGAGILADTRAFQRAGAFGAAVATVLTVQSTSGLESVAIVPPREVARALACVLTHQRVHAVKTGALGGAGVIRAVMRVLCAYPRLPVIVDPVLLPTLTRGAKSRLLAESAVRLMCDAVLPHAFLVTPNADEARALTGIPVCDSASAVEAGRAILAMGARAVLVKGGHIAGTHAVDVLVLRNRVREWKRPRLVLPPIHGGGCTLAALVAGKLANVRGAQPRVEDVEHAVDWARRIHLRALLRVSDVGGRLGVLVP